MAHNARRALKGVIKRMVSELSFKLRELRRQKRMRQDHVAAQASVSRSALSSYESGARRPNYETLVLLADIYGVTTDYLLGRTGRSIDAEGLTPEQYAIVAALVEQMASQNKRLEDLKL